MRDSAHEKLYSLLSDPIPEVIQHPVERVVYVLALATQNNFPILLDLIRVHNTKL